VSRLPSLTISSLQNPLLCLLSHGLSLDSSRMNPEKAEAQRFATPETLRQAEAGPTSTMPSL